MVADPSGIEFVGFGAYDNVHSCQSGTISLYSPDFIRKVQAMHRVHGANGLHLYPQASYWDWPTRPISCLKENGFCRSTGLDMVQELGRYAWKADRPRHEEVYWSDQLGTFTVVEAGRVSLKL